MMKYLPTHIRDYLKLSTHSTRRIALGSLPTWGRRGRAVGVGDGNKRKRQADRRAWTDKQEEEPARPTVGKDEWVSMMTSALLRESPKSVKNENKIPFYLNPPGKQEGVVLTRVVRSRHSLVSRRKSQLPQRESCVTRVGASKRTHAPLGPSNLMSKDLPSSNIRTTISIKNVYIMVICDHGKVRNKR